MSDNWATWRARASKKDGYAISTDGSHAGEESANVWYFKGEVDSAIWWFLHPTGQTPTEADARAAVKRIAGIDLPEPEKEECWFWNGFYERWEPTVIDSPYAQIAMDGTFYCSVTATTATRDAKRDALHAALKAAGKDGAE